MRQSRMDTLKTQATPGTRNRQHLAQDTGNTWHKTQNKDKQNNNTTQQTRKVIKADYQNKNKLKTRE